MGRTPCCDKAKVKRGPWSPEEDMVLKNYIESHGTGGNWIALPQKAGLKRCGKSCRLRWLNYLRPDIKHGGFTKEEDHIICSLYNNIGSRWSVIASRLPGRTDNDVKNYWNTKLKKRMMAAQVTSSNTATSIDTTINNQSNHSPSPPPPPPSTTPLIIPTMKNETYTCDYFQKPLTKDPPTPAPINTAFSFSHYNSLPMAGITDSPGYHGNVCEASSLVTVDNSVSYSNWWTTGSGDSDEFFLEFGDGCPVEFLSGSSNAHEKIADITTNLPSSSHFSFDTEAKLQVT